MEHEIPMSYGGWVTLSGTYYKQSVETQDRTKKINLPGKVGENRSHRGENSFGSSLSKRGLWDSWGEDVWVCEKV